MKNQREDASHREYEAWKKIVAIIRDDLQLKGSGHTSTCRCAEIGCRLFNAIKRWGDLSRALQEVDNVNTKSARSKNDSWVHRDVNGFTFSSGRAVSDDVCVECGRSINKGDRVTLITAGLISDGNNVDIYCARHKSNILSKYPSADIYKAEVK